MNIAIIPARGGSKRIPRKNIKEFCGKPMIAWSIEAALASRLFAHVLVSTDDAEIADVARSAGAEVPFLRPAELSDDHAGTTGVIAHGTAWALARSWEVSAVCCLYPTAPFVRCEDLARGLEMLEASDLQYVFAATSFAYPILRSFLEMEGGRVSMCFPERFEALPARSSRSPARCRSVLLGQARCLVERCKSS
ncbi:MAG: pseudaminic acid cytidylyltransferase [Thermoanaerobaculia bacterium]